MSITNKLKKVFGEDKDTHPTNVKIEEKIEEDEVVGLYLPVHVGRIEPSISAGVSGLSIPVSELSVKEFYSVEEMTDHIREKGADYKKKSYFFDRNDEEVKNAVMNAFKQNRCEKLEEKKQELKEVEKELQELNCEER